FMVPQGLRYSESPAKNPFVVFPGHGEPLSPVHVNAQATELRHPVDEPASSLPCPIEQPLFPRLLLVVRAVLVLLAISDRAPLMRGLELESSTRHPRLARRSNWRNHVAVQRATASDSGCL